MVAGAVCTPQIETGDLTIETHAGTRNQRFPMMHARAVNRMTGREVIGAVENDIHKFDKFVEGLSG